MSLVWDSKFKVLAPAEESITTKKVLSCDFYLWYHAQCCNVKQWPQFLNNIGESKYKWMRTNGRYGLGHMKKDCRVISTFGTMHTCKR
jgi:hypothetical protein